MKLRKTFKTALDNSIVSDFYQVKVKEKEAMEIDPALKVQLDTIDLQLQGLDEQGNTLQAQLGLPGADSITLNEEIAQLSEQADTLIVQKNELTVGKDLVVDSTLESTATQNSGITTTNTYEENEKSFHSVYLATAAKGIYVFDEDQKDIIRFISNQCPLGGGPAVFRARALLGLDHPTVYNDRELCLTAGILIRGQAPVTENSMTLYPNPGDGTLLTLSFEKSLTQETLVEVLGTQGQLWERFVLPAETKTHILRLTELPAGLYIIKAHDAGGLNFVARYLLIK